ncbi:MAG: PAS domain S-box protein [Janthinobacterium lividum]
MTDTRFFAAEYPAAAEAELAAQEYDDLLEMAAAICGTPDFEPCQLTPSQERALQALSRQAVSLRKLRRSVNCLERDLAERDLVQSALCESEARLRESEANLQVACRAGKITLWEDHLQIHRVSWSQSQAQVDETGHSEASESWKQALDWIHQDDRERAIAARTAAINTLSPLKLEMRVLYPDEAIHWLLLQGEVSTDADGLPLRISGSIIDITERKQFEEALRLSEERLRNIIKGAPLVLFSLDAAGAFTLSEGKGLDVLGLRPGELVGHSAYDLYAAYPDFLQHLECAYRGEAFSDRCRIDDFTFEIWYSPVFGSDGSVTSVIGVAYDITARRQAEEALRSSEARFQAFMDNSPATAYVKDDTGRFVYVNDALLRITGLLEQDCLGKTSLEIFPGELGERLHAETQKTLVSNYLTESLTHMPAPTGETIDWLSFRFTFWDTQHRQFVGCLGLDVTEQNRAEKHWKEAQQKLEETLSQLHATLEATADGLLVVNNEGSVLCANGNFYEMWRIPEEVTQQRDDSSRLKLVMEQLRDPEAFLARVMYLKSHPDELSFDTLEFKDGRIFERSLRPLLIQGVSAGRVWSFRDVTQQEQTRQELIRAKNHALASAQAKSEFLANMSHEIRTPMNGILGMTDLLLAKELPPQQKHYAVTIKNSADSLLTVINDILDFSKIEAGKMTLESVPFSIEQVMQEVKDLLGPRAEEKKLSLSCSMPLNFPPALCGDPARLRQILTNLVGNALKFTERGKVVLEARVLRETETHAEFRLSVRDTGIGIPKDRQEAIFDSFTQADGSITRRYGGTGLGLAICLRLTDLMAGRIGLASAPGQGSEFWLIVTLEKMETVLEQPAVSLWPTEAEPLGLRVLLAEDNAINREVACGFLEMWGCTVDVAGNGWQACRAAREKPYDLVLMDIQMPEMDGRQATAEIRGRERGTTRHLPIIAMTAHNMQGDREQCLACGMDDYVSKPVDPEELLAALKRWGRPAQVSINPSVPEAPAVPVAQPTQEEPKLPVLDIERLHRSCAGKAKLERRIMVETLRLSPLILERLCASVNAADAELTRFEAHTLKGSSRTLGAEALGMAAALMEDTAKAGNLSESPVLLNQIKVEWSALRGVLEDCLTLDPWKEAL